MKEKKNPFSQHPKKVASSSNEVLLTTFSIRDDKPCGLFKDLWLMVMQYLSAKELNTLMFTSHSFRLNALESIRRRAHMPVAPIGSFFNVRMGFYRILLQQINSPEIAIALNDALEDPVIQKKIFNKIPARIVAEWSEKGPQKFGQLIHYMLKTSWNIPKLEYIFKHFKSLLERLDQKGMDAVRSKVSEACNPPSNDATAAMAYGLF
ncbi:MAG TPA: F-box protein [Gammaproteobacteria bacterium]|nr:F-box protein [Gammaproteobacteria bacterium]